MLASDPQLTVRALQPVVAGLRALGHPVSEPLAAAGIPAGTLENPDGKVPQRSMMRLWESVDRATGDDLLGFHLARAAPVESFDMHAYAVLSSPTLRDAYRRACRYQRLIHETTVLSLHEEGGRGVLRHHLPSGRSVGRHPAEFLVTAWVRFGRLVTGTGWAPELVCFDHEAPALRSQLDEYFATRVQFRSGRTAIELATTTLDAANARSDPTLLRLLDEHAGLLLERQPERSGTGGRVHAWLAGSSSAERPTAAQAARALHVSVRTLRRHLLAEGTSFREILDGYRHERAVTLLSSPRYGIADVAFLLGFSELSAFYRAFRRWTGTTPAEFRDAS